MSKYTTEVRYICEHYAGLNESAEYSSVEDVISRSRDKIFDFSYPIYDVNYKSVLETKILKHYYTREIGEETVGLWKLRLNTRMNEIMPFYNQLYESVMLKFNPLENVNLTKDKDITNAGENASNTTTNVESEGDTTHTGTVTDVGHMERESVTTHNESEDHWDMYSDTPQGGLTGVRTEEYLTNARHNTDSMTGTLADTTEERDTTNTTTFNDNIHKDNTTDSESNTSANFTTTEDYLEHIKGLNGKSYSRLLMEFRETFLNIDVLIIDELSDLFLNLW